MCGKLPPQLGFAPGEWLNAAMLQMDWIKAREPDSRWVMVVLHGLGDSMEGYRWVPRLLHYPNLHCILVNAPDAFYGGFAWYEFTGNESVGIERSYRLIEGLLNDLNDKGHPPEQVFLFGFSQGCLMAVETALRYPHRLAGCIGVSGYVHQPEAIAKRISPAAREQHLLITHGTRDGLLSMDRIRPGLDQLRAQGLQLEFHEYEKDHEIIEPEIGLFRRFLEERMAAALQPPRGDDKSG